MLKYQFPNTCAARAQVVVRVHHLCVGVWGLVQYRTCALIQVQTPAKTEDLLCAVEVTCAAPASVKTIFCASVLFGLR